jgi:hypothetical protein
VQMMLKGAILLAAVSVGSLSRIRTGRVKTA